MLALWWKFPGHGRFSEIKFPCQRNSFMPLQKSGECSFSPFESAEHSKDGTVLSCCLLVSCDRKEKKKKQLCSPTKLQHHVCSWERLVNAAAALWKHFKLSPLNLETIILWLESHLKCFCKSEFSCAGKMLRSALSFYTAANALH